MSFALNFSDLASSLARCALKDDKERTAQAVSQNPAKFCKCETRVKMNSKRFLFILAAFFLDVFFISHFSLFNFRLSFFLWFFYFFCCQFALDELLVYCLTIGFLNDLLTASLWGTHSLILSFLVLGVFVFKKLFLIRWNALVFFLPPFFLMFNSLVFGNLQISFITVLQLTVNWIGCLLSYLLLSSFLTKPFGFKEKIEIQR